MSDLIIDPRSWWNFLGMSVGLMTDGSTGQPSVANQTVISRYHLYTSCFIGLTHSYQSLLVNNKLWFPGTFVEILIRTDNFIRMTYYVFRCCSFFCGLLKILKHQNSYNIVLFIIIRHNKKSVPLWFHSKWLFGCRSWVISICDYSIQTISIQGTECGLKG